MFNRPPERPEDERSVADSIADALSRLPAVKAPDAIWNSIEVSLASLDSPPRSPWRLSSRGRWVLLLPAAVLLLISAVWSWNFLHATRWQVVRTSAGQASQTESIRAGEWLQTDASSHAEMRIGAIGTVEVEPRTRLRIVATKPLEHRISLQHGEISATINAPPKLFFVDTKSATAVDLGCQYDMKVDDAGNGLLTVTIGWVAFEWEGRESLVPAGAQCRTHAGAGPGTPYFDDAPKSLTAALQEFDFAKGGEESLHEILAAARSRDTLTLWHLLARVGVPERQLIYDRMASFAPLPAGVTRDKVLALDPPTLKMWKDELAWSW